MTDGDQSLVDQLVAKAYGSERLNFVLATAADLMTEMFGDIDMLLALEQGGSDDTTDRVVRALVLRGMFDNVVEVAYRRFTDSKMKEKET